MTILYELLTPGCKDFTDMFDYLKVMYCCSHLIFCTAQVQVDGKNVPTAVKVLSKHRVLDVSLGPAHSAALVEPGLVYTFGDNQYGQLACNNCKPRDVPAIVKALEEKTTSVRCK